jgi:tRNA threonylcarbamoyladenosine modification (KEOPS) complex  Pcc1 subunit
MLMRFSSFLDKKNKQAIRELGIVRDILGEGDLKVEDFLKSESPYLFVNCSEDGLDFEGVRVYKIGSSLAYRVQKENKTEPYGEAYSLDLEDLFGDLVSDMSEEKAAEEIKKAVVEEFKNFFSRSSRAQEELNSGGLDPQSKIVVSGGAGDLSNTSNVG